MNEAADAAAASRADALARPPSPCADASHTVRKTARGWPGRWPPRSWRWPPAELAGPLEAAGVPVELQPQCVVHLGGARAGEPRRRGTVAGVGGQAVDVGSGQAGVLDGVERRLQREVQAVAVEASADGGLADAGDDCAALDRSRADLRLEQREPHRRRGPRR